MKPETPRILVPFEDYMRAQSWAKMRGACDAILVVGLTLAALALWFWPKTVDIRLARVMPIGGGGGGKKLPPEPEPVQEAAPELRTGPLVN